METNVSVLHPVTVLNKRALLCKVWKVGTSREKVSVLGVEVRVEAPLLLAEKLATVAAVMASFCQRESDGAA